MQGTNIIMTRHSVAKITVLVGALLWLPANLCAEEVISREYKIKAAYLFNLIKFVSWPSAAQSVMKAEKRTLICVFGHNPFANHLEKLSHRKAKGRDIAIKYLAPQNSTEQCNVVFISELNAETNPLLSKSQRQAPPLLTVGENADFVDQGGIVSLVVEDNNVKLQINLTQAKKMGFEVSGNLLEVAKVVR